MRVPDEVASMLHLHRLGWGLRRIGREVGCSPMTVRRYVAADGWAPYRSPERPGLLAGHEVWLAERFRHHRGKADVVRQELAGELGIAASLRTVERAVAHLRQELAAEALATVRFETPPGCQLQIDFGERGVRIGDEAVRVYLFVATLGYSRRVYVRAFRHERQSAWFDGIEGAFEHFGGLPGEVLLDNAKALVDHHDAGTREVTFNARFHAFARYWAVRPVACAPYRARTKGKDERGVGYVKRNAIAGRDFASWAALEAHLAWWMREVADVRVHGTTGEAPMARFERDEAARRDLTLPETLALLCEAEVAHREERRIQMGMGIAKFPYARTLEAFDFAAQPSLDPKQLRDLAACRWVAGGDTLLIQGPPGVGKSHLAVALGREAVRQGYSVLFTSAVALITGLVKGQAEGRLEERLTRYAKPKLLIVDEFGYLPFETQAAHLFFALVSRRYERGSMLVTSNRSVSEWGMVLNDQVVATAILDRLLHHSHVLTIRGDSYRLREKRRSGLLKRSSADASSETV